MADSLNTTVVATPDQPALPIASSTTPQVAIPIASSSSLSATSSSTVVVEGIGSSLFIEGHSVPQPSSPISVAFTTSFLAIEHSRSIQPGQVVIVDLIKGYLILPDDQGDLPDMSSLRFPGDEGFDGANASRYVPLVGTGGDDDHASSRVHSQDAMMAGMHSSFAGGGQGGIAATYNNIDPSSPPIQLKQVFANVDELGYIFDGNQFLVGQLIAPSGSMMPISEQTQAQEPYGEIEQIRFYLASDGCQLFSESRVLIGRLFPRVSLPISVPHDRMNADGSITITLSPAQLASSSLLQRRALARQQREESGNSIVQVSSGSLQAQADSTAAEATHAPPANTQSSATQVGTARVVDSQSGGMQAANAQGVGNGFQDFVSDDSGPWPDADVPWPNPPGFVPVNLVPAGVTPQNHVLFTGTGVYQSFSDGSVKINGVVFRPEAPAPAAPRPAPRSRPFYTAQNLPRPANNPAPGPRPRTPPFGGNPYWPFNGPHQSSSFDTVDYPVYGANQITRTGPVTLQERMAFLNSTPPMRFAGLDHPESFTHSGNPMESYDEAYQRNLREMESDM